MSFGFGPGWHQRLQKGPHARGIPIRAAIQPGHHLASRVNNNGYRHAIRIEQVQIKAIWVQQNRQVGDVVLLVKWLHGLRAVYIDGNREDQPAKLADFSGQGGESGNFLDTGATPGGPNIHHQHMPCITGKAEFLAFRICKLQRRGGSWLYNRKLIRRIRQAGIIRLCPGTIACKGTRR